MMAQRDQRLREAEECRILLFLSKEVTGLYKTRDCVHSHPFNAQALESWGYFLLDAA